MKELEALNVISNGENGKSVATSTRNSSLGLLVGGVIGASALAITLIATPFVLPAIRKYCLPYVPATDTQLKNLAQAFRLHASRGDSFLDIGSGDGRICRLARDQRTFSEVHGVELNSILVLYSRILGLKPHPVKIKYFHRNLWKFPLSNYDSICIFGVESMMKELETHLVQVNCKSQTVFACRFPFKNLKKMDEIGSGIDTVWVYRIESRTTKDL